MSTSTEVEVRCPNSTRRLFFKLRSSGAPTPIVDGNLIELACVDCRRQLAKEGRPVSHVLHYYNFIGEWVSTKVVV